MNEQHQQYITSNPDGTFDAFVQGEPVLESVRLRDALSYIRVKSGRADGDVPCFIRATRRWEADYELNPIV